jgi:DeoR/GlpR family transcriptional regulator of sugar metabolism
MRQQNDFMYFKELAVAFGISPQTLRKKIKAHSDKNISKFASKRGTGTYFYTKEEIKLLFYTFSY